MPNSGFPYRSEGRRFLFTLLTRRKPLTFQVIFGRQEANVYLPRTYMDKFRALHRLESV